MVSATTYVVLETVYLEPNLAINVQQPFVLTWIVNLF